MIIRDVMCWVGPGQCSWAWQCRAVCPLHLVCILFTFLPFYLLPGLYQTPFCLFTAPPGLYTFYIFPFYLLPGLYQTPFLSFYRSTWFVYFLHFCLYTFYLVHTKHHFTFLSFYLVRTKHLFSISISISISNNYFFPRILSTPDALHLQVIKVLI